MRSRRDATPFRSAMLAASLTMAVHSSPAAAQHGTSGMSDMMHGAKAPAAAPAGSNAVPDFGAPVSDNMPYRQILVDQLEYVDTRRGNGWAWDAQGFAGRDLNKLWVKTEGQRIAGKTEGARVEALWSRAIAAFWDLQLGVRHDFAQGPSRQWLAVGVQGLAPWWFDVEATAYLGPSGRTAARLKAEYSLPLTQRVFLAPRIEADLFGKADPQRNIGSGLSEIAFGLRLRYEIRREFAPYLGIGWTHRAGQTAALPRHPDEPATLRRVVAGVRFWF